jgi:hypothetical protein
MKVKLKICTGGCQKPSVIWKNSEGLKYCKSCWSNPMRVPTKQVAKKQSFISPRSSKKEKLDAAYSVLRVVFLKQHPNCKCNLPGCTGVATQVHHMAGRVGELYLDTTKWLPVCHHCHHWVELHPEEAKELGFSLNRL